MRDLIVALLIMGAMPTCFRKPFVGLLLFSLLAYMRLQDLTWGFAREVRWSFYVAIVTFAGFFASTRERRFMQSDLRTAIMIVMVGLVGLSILKNRGPNLDDLPSFLEYSKIVVIALFTSGLVYSRDRLRLLIWVIAVSFAFYGFKGGLMGILSGGSLVIMRGPGGMLKDNNDFALALGMGIPILLNVGLSEKRVLLRRALIAVVPLTMITILLTHSRGGFLAMCVGIMVLVWRSKNRIAGFAVISLVVIAGILAAPSSVVERISSIGEYEEDDSAQSRLAAWRVAGVMISRNPVFGVGFGHFQDNYRFYDPAAEDSSLDLHTSHVAHNSYLQIWAECGTPTFLLYLTLILLSFLDLWRLRAAARRRYHVSWILNYTTMFEAALCTFVVGSVFLNRAQFDLFYHMVAIILAFTTIARKEMEDPVKYPELVDQRRILEPVARSGFGPGTQRNGFKKRPALERGF